MYALELLLKFGLRYLMKYIDVDFAFSHIDIKYYD